MSDEVNFLHSDKHESFLQNDAIILLEFAKHSQSSQNGQFAISLQYLKKEVRSGVHFLHTDKSFCKLESSLLMEVPRHAQYTQTSKLSKFLQYIKKKLLQLLL